MVDDTGRGKKKGRQATCENKLKEGGKKREIRVEGGREGLNGDPFASQHSGA